MITMLSVFTAMTLHPEVLEKAHAELDAVVGHSRLPDFNDEESLVYVNAIIKEAMRWHTALPFSLPHATTADDEFQGYFIPAGTTLLANTWCVSAFRSHYPSTTCPLGHACTIPKRTEILTSSDRNDSF